MKKFLLFAALALPISLLCGCNSPSAAPPDPIVEHDVTLLFQKDGVKVYRFFDLGNALYYTDARGQTTSFQTKRSGKATTTVRHSIPTVQ